MHLIEKIMDTELVLVVAFQMNSQIVLNSNKRVLRPLKCTGVKVSTYLKNFMHLKPPSFWLPVSEVTCNEGAQLKQDTPTQEHENTMKGNQVKICRATPTSRWSIINI